jgi:hypothetical protein
MTPSGSERPMRTRLPNVWLPMEKPWSTGDSLIKGLTFAQSRTADPQMLCEQPSWRDIK